MFLGIPSPPPLKARSLVFELKARLGWGAPLLTIIDAREAWGKLRRTQ